MTDQAIVGALGTAESVLSERKAAVQAIVGALVGIKSQAAKCETTKNRDAVLAGTVPLRRQLEAADLALETAQTVRDNASLAMLQVRIEQARAANEQPGHGLETQAAWRRAGEAMNGERKAQQRREAESVMTRGRNRY